MNLFQRTSAQEAVLEWPLTPMVYRPKLLREHRLEQLP